MDRLFGLLTCVTILLAKMLIWATFSQSMSTFAFRINPCKGIIYITSVDTSVQHFISHVKSFSGTEELIFILQRACLLTQL